MVTETNDLDVALEALGYSVTFKMLRDDFDGREGSHTFAVKLGRNGQSFEFEYTAGCAHRHYDGSCLPAHRRGDPIEYSYNGRMSVDEFAYRQRTNPNNPTLADLVHCVVMDAQAVADGQDFETFASDFGYDEDSRKAEKCFNGCRDAYFALVRMGADFDGLAELFQDV